MIRVGQTRNLLRASSSLLEIWPRSAHHHPGQRHLSGRTNRPDKSPHSITCLMFRNSLQMRAASTREGWTSGPSPPLHRFAQRSIVGTDAGVAHRRTVEPQSLARPTLAHPMYLAGMNNRLPLRVGVTIFSPRHPSGSRCRASVRRAASSSGRSRTQEPSGDGRRTRPFRRTWP